MPELYVGQVSEYALIFNEYGEILLLQHNGGGNGEVSPHYAKWHFPGGRLDMDDVPGEALQREILEETGLTGVELIVPCHASRWGFDVPEKYSTTYLARTKGRPEVILPAGEHHMAAQWVPWREAVGYTFIHAKQPSIIEAVAVWAKKLGVLNET